ncbi:MAG TPA: Fic family protein [Solirubrobacterales bacterium]|nr:Fic family protein [Solirubrobacterales bacterium]
MSPVELETHAPTSFGEARLTSGRHGYVAYFPATIPRALDLPASTVRLLGEAEGALGRLAGVGRLLPNPDLLIRPYLLREALSSTRIEGTQASMVEVFEADAAGEAPNADVEEVVNYVAAMRWGLERLDELPLSTRLLCEMHRRLMAGVRGRELAPGELRTSQNWIGAPGSTIETAQFVPPPPAELSALLADWERFAHEQPELPLLVQNALLHSQFETIHPFLDGNGRLGRLLLVFFLIARGRLTVPLLYLSAYLERQRQDYYDALQAIRESGDPTPWIDLFLTAVETQADDAVQRAQRIVALRESYLQEAATMGTPNALTLVDLICENPVLTTRSIEDRLDVSRPTALRLLRRMEEQGVLTETDSGARGQRRYVARAMMEAVGAWPAPRPG